jgi:hypothetical protein
MTPTDLSATDMRRHHHSQMYSMTPTDLSATDMGRHFETFPRSLAGRYLSVSVTYDVTLLVNTHLKIFCRSADGPFLVSVITSGVNGPLRIEISITLK